MRIGFIPSVSGGLGHITRTFNLAQGLERADPTLQIAYVVDGTRLRDFNVQVVRRTGYPVRVLQSPRRGRRTEVVRRALGGLDGVVEDTCRHLIAYRSLLPQLRVWISVPMWPLGDELFQDLPLLEHADHILYAYPRIMGIPDELRRFRSRLTVTGPILDPEQMPTRAQARTRLRMKPADPYLTYAPRGFPFGTEFGLRVLSGVIRGFMRLRRKRRTLRLILTAVPDAAAVQPTGLPRLDRIDGLVIKGVLTPERARDVLAGADLAVTEGTSTLFDAAMARTPVLMIPGTIYEAWLEGTWVQRYDAGVVVWEEEATADRMAEAMEESMASERAAQRTERLHRLVGTGGREKAVRAVLSVLAARVGR